MYRHQPLKILSHIYRYGISSLKVYNKTYLTFDCNYSCDNVATSFKQYM